MGRKSSIRRQPSDVREAIGQWHRDGRTLDEIVAALEETFQVKLSRSALHRHVKGLDRTLARIDRSRAVAEAAVARFGKEPDNRVARKNIEVAHALISEIMELTDEEEQPEAGKDKDRVSTPMGAMLLSKAIEHLTKAGRHDAELVAKIRAEARKEMEKEVKARADELCRAENLKELTSAELKRRIAELAGGVS